MLSEGKSTRKAGEKARPQRLLALTVNAARGHARARTRTHTHTDPELVPPGTIPPDLAF